MPARVFGSILVGQRTGAPGTHGYVDVPHAILQEGQGAPERRNGITLT